MSHDDTSALSFQKRLRTLAFTRSGSSSPGKAAVRDAFASDTDEDFKRKYVAQLGKDRPLKDRVECLLTTVNQLHRCSSSTVLAILHAADDLFDETADLESRKAGFTFLTKTAAVIDLDEVTKAKILDCIVEPAHPSCIAGKIAAIDQLTERGTRASNFQPRVISFVGELLFDCFVAVDRSRSEKRPKSSSSDEENNLVKIWNLLNQLIIHDFPSLDDTHASRLLDRLTTICKKTTAGSDLTRAIDMISAFAARVKVPDQNLDSLINLLCHTSYAVEKCRDASQSCLDKIFMMSNTSMAMEVLLRNLSKDSNDSVSNMELRGSLLQLEHIYDANGIGSNLGPPLPELVQALKKAALVDYGGRKHNQASLTLSIKATASILKNDLVRQSLVDSDRTCMEAIVDMICEKAAGSSPVGKILYDDITAASPIFLFARSMVIRQGMMTEETIQPLQAICRVLSGIFPRISLEKRTMIVNLFLLLGNVAEPAMLSVVIAYMDDNRLVFPPDENWLPHLALLIEVGFLDSSKDPSCRQRALELISDVYDVVSGEPESTDLFCQQLIKLVHGARIGHSSALNRNLMGLVSKVLRKVKTSMFDLLLAALVESAVEKSSVEVALLTSAVPEDGVGTTDVHLVESLLGRLPDQVEKERKIYDALIAVANTSKASTDVRLDAIKLLSRLRCQQHSLLRTVEIPDMKILAATSTKPQINTGPSSEPAPFRMEESPRSRSDGTTGPKNLASGDVRARPQSTSRKRIEKPKSEPMKPINICMTASQGSTTIDLSSWLELILDVLKRGTEWEFYSYIMVHLPSQLANVSLFANNLPRIEKLHDLLVYQLQKGKFPEPPTSVDLRKGHVAVCLYQILTVLIPYSGWFLPQKMTDTVHTFLIGISQWNQTVKCCIHALALCCHELPRGIDKCLPLILTKMSQIITQSHFAIDILEFLTRLARLPAAYQSIGEEPLRTVFGICIRHLHHSREVRQLTADSVNLSSTASSKRCSNVSGTDAVSSDSSQAVSNDKELPEYVYALAYHVITHWFLAIPIQNRSKHVGWIAKNLAWKNHLGEEIVEEQSQVTLDMMHRTAYLDLGETLRPTIPADEKEHMIKTMYLTGMSIVTMETNSRTGLTYITKRQASGTTNATYQPCTAPLPAHHAVALDPATSTTAASSPLIYPQHVLLQLNSTISPMPIPEQPIVLPDDGTPERSITQIDRIATVDSYKAGVIYVAKGQRGEKEILANTSSSEVFDAFVAGIGTKIPLQGATFNACGLDKVSNADGTHTIAWRDRVSEIIFHVPTMMPNLEHDAQCTNKKMHTGNDYVNIIFNESGLPFEFDTFPSALNYVNIVITPEKVAAPQSASRSADDDAPTAGEDCYFFTVQVLCAPFLPEMSPAATTKVVSASALPGYVRQLALNAHLFSVVWSERAQGEERVSSWRSRLREIRKLRERYANTGNSANVGYPEMGTAKDRGGARSYVEGDEWKGTLAMGGLAEQGQFLMSLDFTRWT
ncbi:MAG: hypothetical protein Q9168_001214 [Polycauliona sp. 1 TL-2023]